MKHTLEVDSIILEFDTKRVLQDVYLKNETGKATGILGRNGSGKTCLMNIIYGELKTTNKSIRLDGNVIYDAYRNPGNIRYLPQFNFMPGNITIKRIFNDFRLDFSRFAGYFPEFKKYYSFKIGKLSGGESRIVEIYVILASKTKFCMLDEPFSQVMPVHVETIKKLIRHEKTNKGIIITDHLYEHIIDTCDEIYVISNGITYLTKDNNDLMKLGYLNKN
ncbi:ATP-binding cassette domain-containing protein [Maribellus sediminis]|uniref:ATP-binding cassette domain-containing protein n=1 Tax=Maribellus sediminis TaxID=2696285 RepID=UPI001430D30B|nr:ATP-binding cassette domain-containing protein [Maribellus sediminis]